MNRLRIFFTFAAVIALATALAACGGDSGDSSPEAVIDEATFQGAKSGDLDINLAVDANGPEGGQIDVSLSGPFQSGAKGQPPRLSLTVKADGSLGGDRIDFEGGLVLLSNKAYVNYEGVDYEVDPTTYSFVKSSLGEAQKEGGQSTDVTACQEAASELELGEFFENLSDDGSADVGGTSTTKITGDLDVSATLDSLIELSNEPACESLKEAEGPLALTDEGVEAVQEQLESALKSATIEVNVGDDDIVRKLATQINIEPEEEGTGPESINLDFDLTMTGVNEDQPIVAPSKSKPLSELFVKLGINPIELLGLLEGEGLGSLLGQIGGSGDGKPYTECLQSARSAADIQKCGAKLR